MTDFQPGDVFAGHRIEAVAGRGGMGVVYRATQLALDRTVALKVIAPEPPRSGLPRAVRARVAGRGVDRPPERRSRSTRPARRTGIAYIAMRYVDGRRPARAACARDGPLEPDARGAASSRRSARALDAAHAAGLVHRDIKPANILLGRGDHVYLTDFGLTKRVGAERAA